MNTFYFSTPIIIVVLSNILNQIYLRYLGHNYVSTPSITIKISITVRTKFFPFEALRISLTYTQYHYLPLAIKLLLTIFINRNILLAIFPTTSPCATIRYCSLQVMTLILPALCTPYL